MPADTHLGSSTHVYEESCLFVSPWRVKRGFSSSPGQSERSSLFQSVAVFSSRCVSSGRFEEEEAGQSCWTAQCVEKQIITQSQLVKSDCVHVFVFMCVYLCVQYVCCTLTWTSVTEASFLKPDRFMLPPAALYIDTHTRTHS